MSQSIKSWWSQLLRMSYNGNLDGNFWEKNFVKFKNISRVFHFKGSFSANSENWSDFHRQKFWLRMYVFSPFSSIFCLKDAKEMLSSVLNRQEMKRKFKSLFSSSILPKNILIHLLLVMHNPCVKSVLKNILSFMFPW